jgi:hypothetical protein
MSRPDVDIDFGNREELLHVLNGVPAMITTGHGATKHKTGVYFHPVPINPYTGWCSLDHKEAEELGFFKLDLLNVSFYSKIKNKEQLDRLIAKEPIWDLLTHDEFSSKLLHVNGHGEILRKTKPSNIEQLAAVLGMIRPAKRYLVNKEWTQIMKEVWVKPTTDEYFFKKSHATAYAIMIVAQMNLLCEELIPSS